jgi:hypothetical protein
MGLQIDQDRPSSFPKTIKNAARRFGGIWGDCWWPLMTVVCDALEASGSPYISNSQHCHFALLVAVDSVTASLGAHIDRSWSGLPFGPLLRCFWSGRMAELLQQPLHMSNMFKLTTPVYAPHMPRPWRYCGFFAWFGCLDICAAAFMWKATCQVHPQHV